MPVLWAEIPEPTPALTAVLTPCEKIAFRIGQTLLPPDAVQVLGCSRNTFNGHMRRIRYKAHCLKLGITIKPKRTWR